MGKVGGGSPVLEASSTTYSKISCVSRFNCDETLGDAGVDEMPLGGFH